MTAVTLHLPDSMIKRVQQAAEVLQRPVEEVLTDMLAAALPEVNDAPPDIQARLMHMTWLDDQALWAIAHNSMSEPAQEQLHQLSQLQATRPLTQEEQEQLERLRQEYGQITLLKARAYALLSLRGGKPLLTVLGL